MLLEYHDYRFVDEEDCLRGWEKSLIEWCFQYPENEVCGMYFRAVMNEDVRNRMRRGAC